MPRARVGEVELEYEVLGPPGGRPLLLIGGLGSQLVSWDDEFCGELVRRGYTIIRYDNRDSGLSTSLDVYGVPDLLGLLTGTASPPYTLDDMTADAAGLLQVIGLGPVHVLGLSLGGMIGQLLALSHPEMVISLVAALSGPAGRPTDLPAPEVVDALLRPPAETFGDRVQAAVELRRALAAHDEFNGAQALRRAELQIKRAYNPAGTMRQAAAVLGTANRLAELKRVRVPTMLVHGELDPLISLASAEQAASTILRARLFVLRGIGHDLPPAAAMGLVDRLEQFHSTLTAARPRASRA